MSILDLPAGLHADVPAEIYHARHLGLVSKGAIDIVRRSPAHYLEWVRTREPEEDTAALAFGKALHCALLEPHVFDETYAVEPDFGDCRFKEPKASRDAWRAANTGMILISAENFRMMRGMANSVCRHPIAARMLEDGTPELTVRWKDKETGLECKARADYHIGPLQAVFDIKTTEDASEDAFRRSVVKYGYHRQAALYMDGFAAVGSPLESFVFIVIEKSPPFAVATYEIYRLDIGKGRSAVRVGMQRLAECIEQNVWPAYGTGIQTIMLPDWS